MHEFTLHFYSGLPRWPASNPIAVGSVTTSDAFKGLHGRLRALRCAGSIPAELTNLKRLTEIYFSIEYEVNQS